MSELMNEWLFPINNISLIEWANVQQAALLLYTSFWTMILMYKLKQYVHIQGEKILLRQIGQQ